MKLDIGEFNEKLLSHSNLYFRRIILNTTLHNSIRFLCRPNLITVGHTKTNVSVVSAEYIDTEEHNKSKSLLILDCVEIVFALFC
jgi:hypothetical protein